MVTGSQLSPDPDLIAHERTYHGFNVLLRWSMLLLGDSILSLCLWFLTPAGFLGALVVGVLVFLVGYQVLIRREERQPIDPWTPH